VSYLLDDAREEAARWRAKADGAAAEISALKAEVERLTGEKQLLVETLALAAKRIDQRTRCECGSSRWECVGCADGEDFQNVSHCRPLGRGGEAVKDLGVVTVEMRRCAHGSCLVNGIKEPSCACFCHEIAALRAEVERLTREISDRDEQQRMDGFTGGSGG
jgi:uncharacterized small protein (DUF1192 family)